MQNPKPSPITQEDLNTQTEEVLSRVQSELVEQSASLIADLQNHAADLEDAKNTVQATQLAAAAEYEARRVKVDMTFQTFRIVILVAAILFIAINSLLYYLYLNPRPGKSAFILGAVTMLSPSELCPGDDLGFSVDVDVKESGLYSLDLSTWRIEPPPSTVILSEAQRFIIGEKRTFTITRKWRIPSTFIDPATNERTEWTPGRYSRDMAVSTVSAGVSASILVVPFEIKPDCEE